jgi:hypothetical protein
MHKNYKQQPNNATLRGKDELGTNICYTMLDYRIEDAQTTW